MTDNNFTDDKQNSNENFEFFRFAKNLFGFFTDRLGFTMGQAKPKSDTSHSSYPGKDSTILLSFFILSPVAILLIGLVFNSLLIMSLVSIVIYSFLLFSRSFALSVRLIFSDNNAVSFTVFICFFACIGLFLANYNEIMLFYNGVQS